MKSTNEKERREGDAEGEGQGLLRHVALIGHKQDMFDDGCRVTECQS